jgi:hypothetical protein
MVTDRDITIQAWGKGDVPKLFDDRYMSVTEISALCTGRLYPHETPAESTPQP